MEHFRHIMEIVGTVVDAAGVLIVVVGALLVTGRFCSSAPPTPTGNTGRISAARFCSVWNSSSRATSSAPVVVAPTLENVLILGLIVLIRTFLSFSLQLEIEGRWPWQRVSAENT